MAELSNYIHHAERFGSECVFETAVNDLEPTDLARLVGRIRRLDPKWRLERTERDVLILALDREGVQPKKIAFRIRVDVRTVRQVLDLSKSGSEGAFQSGKSEQDRVPLTDYLRPPVLFPTAA